MSLSFNYAHPFPAPHLQFSPPGANLTSAVHGSHECRRSGDFFGCGTYSVEGRGEATTQTQQHRSNNTVATTQGVYRNTECSVESRVTENRNRKTPPARRRHECVCVDAGAASLALHFLDGIAEHDLSLTIGRHFSFLRAICGNWSAWLIARPPPAIPRYL